MAETLKEKLKNDHTPVSRALFSAVLDNLGPAIKKSILDHIDKATSPLLKRIAALEGKPQALSYEGVWHDGQEARAGHFYTHGGSVFHCRENTRTRPGESTAWQLAVKGAR